jgi:hypothetical protein
MISGPIHGADLSVLAALIEHEVSEGPTLEYKSALPGSADSDKLEFLADVSSFANSNGGDIVYGMAEESGVPVGFPGVLIEDLDFLKLRLESIIRDGTDPRLIGVDFHRIQVDGGNSVLIIRVPRSWGAPHRVTYKAYGHFYARNTAGKYRMDVDQLRAAFVSNEAVADRVRSFRRDRIGIVRNVNAAPVRIGSGPKLILHILPVASFALGVRLIDVVSESTRQFSPMGTRGPGDYTSRLNLEGRVNHTLLAHGSSDRYTQVFRSGALEKRAGLGYQTSEHPERAV